MDDDSDATDRARRRLRGFIIHLMVYFAAMTVLLPVNLVFMPDSGFSASPVA
jgi:hypothetical protein